MTAHPEPPKDNEPSPFYPGLCLAVLLILVLPLPPDSSPAHAGARLVTFPGTSEAVAAPIGSLSLESVDASRGHQLHVRDRGTSRLVWSHDYPRFVRAGWSLDGRELAVTDFESRDRSHLLIVQTGQRETPKVVDVNREFLRSQAVPALGGGRSLSLEGLRWLSPDRLLVRSDVHRAASEPQAGNIAASPGCYVYQVGKTFRPARPEQCRG